MTEQADLERRVRERMATTGESYAAARVHVLADRPGTTLHVTNGDATVPGLRATGLAQVIIAWRDVLHEGAGAGCAGRRAPARPSGVPRRRERR